MRVEYTLIPKQEATVKDTEVSQYMYKIDQAEVTISVNGNRIKELKIAFCDIGYDVSLQRLVKTGSPRDEELHYNAYDICSYISNRILTESNVDAFDCNEFIDNNAPEIYPENQQEKEDTVLYKTTHSHIFHIVQSIENFADLDKFGEGYQYEKAYTAYADGLRANSVITRYVQFIKAIEALFEGLSNKNTLKGKVSEITKKKNPKFDADFFYQLKDIRDRCEHTHPHNNRTHISTSDVKSLKEVEQNLPDLTQIVKILFDHFKDQTEYNTIENGNINMRKELV